MFLRLVPCITIALILAAAPARGSGSEPGALVCVGWHTTSDLEELERSGSLRWIEPGEAMLEVSRGQLAALAAKNRVAAVLVPEIGEGFYWLVSGLAAENRQMVCRGGEIVHVSSSGMGLVRRHQPGPPEPVVGCRFMRLPDRVSATAWTAPRGSESTPRVLETLRMPGSFLLETARWAADQVDSNIIETHIRELSTYPDGTPRTRHYLRDSTYTEAAVYIEDSLAGSLTAPGDAVWRQPFLVRYTAGGQSREKYVDNIIGLHKGSGGGGAYIVSGHYDAIALRTAGWDWETDPAPGADDNATGVACFLECARILGGLSFDFDILFVGFTGEEYGLLGSEYYVEEAVAAGDSILGVLNIDMVGYDPDGLRRTMLLTNDRSEWIADWLIEMTDSLDLDLDVLKVMMPGGFILRSDHGHFVVQGYPAVSCWEDTSGDYNPYYHTVADTAGHVSISLTTDIGALFAGTLALLAEPGTSADFVVPPDGVIVRPREITAGDEVTIQAVVRNLGPATDGPVNFESTLLEGPHGGGLRTVAIETVSLDLPSGAWKYVTFEWVPGEGSAGDRDIAVRVVPQTPAADSNLENNQGTRSVAIWPATIDLVYTYPNPVLHLSDLTFHYWLGRRMGVKIIVYTLEGEEIAMYHRRHDPIAEQDGTLPGENLIRWESFDSRPASLASGLYLYSIRVQDESSEKTVLGKFAVTR